MGSGRLDVDPVKIRRAADSLSSVVDKLDSDVAALESDISAYGQPWGGDDIGMLVGLAYQGIHDLAMECYVSNIEELDAIVDDIDTMAEKYENAEQKSVVEVNRVREILG